MPVTVKTARVFDAEIALRTGVTSGFTVIVELLAALKGGESSLFYTRALNNGSIQAQFQRREEQATMWMYSRFTIS